MLRRPGNIPNKVLIAAAALSLTAVTAGISPAASAAGRPPAPSASVAATHVSPRAAVPWRRVGPGWVLAQYWPGRFADPGQAKAAPVSLYLISPAGHRYLLRRWAATRKPLGLTDWAGDKTRVLLFNQLSGRLDGTPVYSTSGATIAVGGAKGLQLVSTNGGVIRRLPVPRTGSSGCLP